MQKKKLKISVISQIHYCKLILRSLLLIAALAAYIVSHLNGSGSMFGGYDSVWIWIAALAFGASTLPRVRFPLGSTLWYANVFVAVEPRPAGIPRPAYVVIGALPAARTPPPNGRARAPVRT